MIVLATGKNYLDGAILAWAHGDYLESIAVARKVYLPIVEE